MTQQIESFELVDVVNGIAVATAQRHHSYELAGDFQRSNALEQLGGDVSIGTKIDIVDTCIQDDRAARGLQGVEVFRQQRDHCRLWHQCESIRRDGTEKRWPVAIGEEHSFPSPAGLQHGRQHGARALRELALGSHLRAEIG